MSQQMSVHTLREKYLRFFESKGHTIHDSGSLIPVDVTGRLDESLLFNGAGMVQFKPYFRGIATPSNKRLTTAQKCVRTGDIDEVGDDSHLTFFEMLGNFSFGDYFKHEAIDYSWEFLTSAEWLGLDPKRLSFTVFESDEEAYDRWAGHISAVGIDPSTRVFRLGEETNYWPAGAFSKGPPGPCGPNSEMFYWTGDSVPEGPYSTEQWLDDDAAKNWLEIWNDVFIQYEWQGTEAAKGEAEKGWTKTGMPNLPFNSIDTGMGLERTAAVLSGKTTVYETDAFLPILSKIRALGSESSSPRREVSRSGETEGGSETKPSQSMEAIQKAERIIADHIRTACFCIADGILPANNGRGYVLRRLIRRAVLKGQRTLGFEELFMHEVAVAVIDEFGGHYRELADRKGIIVETLRNEEALFRKTLKNGVEQLETQIQRVHSDNVLSGEIVFQLYDTFGFPIEITQELCSEAGLTLDMKGYDIAMNAAQVRSRGAGGEKAAYGNIDVFETFKLESTSSSTEFLGYKSFIETTVIEQVRQVGEKLYQVAFAKSPLYAESGGQTGDRGSIQFEQTVFTQIQNTTKSNGVWWHEVEHSDVEKYLGQEVTVSVDVARRAKIQRHHTATHLLQAALRQHLGTGVTQAGSYNGPDNLRFDFTFGKALTAEQIAKVEATVNAEILKNSPVTTYVDLPIDEARAKGAMALFGEKYGDKVRMVEIGEFSKELCGGTHVRTTGEIGLFKIISESSAASGVRRIEAICGEALLEYINQQERDVRDAASLLKTNPKELVSAVEKTVDQLKEERKKREKSEMAAMSGVSSSTEIINVNGVDLWVKNFGEADPGVARSAIDNEANGKPSQVTLGAITTEDGKIQFIAKVGETAQAKGAHAGNMLKEVAKIAGGGGGGQAAFATAGGRDVSKIEAALAIASEVLAKQTA
jgi:alanyl-tRNA synthetase